MVSDASSAATLPRRARRIALGSGPVLVHALFLWVSPGGGTRCAADTVYARGVRGNERSPYCVSQAEARSRVRAQSVWEIGSERDRNSMSQQFQKTKPSFLEAGLPCASLSAECQADNDARQRPPQNRLHIWWARRPPTICRVALLSGLLPYDADLSTT